MTSTPQRQGPICGAKTRPGAKYPICGQTAGWGTAHPGHGKCKLHGGLQDGDGRLKSGRYSKVKRTALRDSIAQYEADPDPLNILPELAAARALFQDFLERYDEWAEALIAWHASFQTSGGPARPHQVLDVSDAYRIVSEITKIVEREHRMRSEGAISLPELERLMHEMRRVVEHHVPDEATVERIRGGWLALRI